MHFARLVSKHIALNRAGLGFLNMPAVQKPRVFGQSNRMTENGPTESAECGITRNRNTNDA
jgi:hypothetical protein